MTAVDDQTPAKAEEDDEETDYVSSSERLQDSVGGRIVRFFQFLNDLLR